MRLGECPECGRLIALRKDGRLRVHGYHFTNGFAQGSNCSGSNKFPTWIKGCE